MAFLEIAVKANIFRAHDAREERLSPFAHQNSAMVVIILIISTVVSPAHKHTTARTSYKQGKRTHDKESAKR
jgi:multisubunit Na+/H+ antiporter MnhG subunit